MTGTHGATVACAHRRKRQHSWPTAQRLALSPTRATRRWTQAIRRLLHWSVLSDASSYPCPAASPVRPCAEGSCASSPSLREPSLQPEGSSRVAAEKGPVPTWNRCTCTLPTIPAGARCRHLCPLGRYFRTSAGQSCRPFPQGMRHFPPCQVVGATDAGLPKVA